MFIFLKIIFKQTIILKITNFFLLQKFEKKKEKFFFSEILFEKLQFIFLLIIHVKKKKVEIPWWIAD